MDITAPRREFVEFAVEYRYNNPGDDKNSGMRYEQLPDGATRADAETRALELRGLITDGGEFWSDVKVLARVVPPWTEV